MAAGIYVHRPFCLRKCFYCDFFSRPVDNFELRREYTRALIYEIAFYGEKYGKNLKADTIFFGGGTPSLMEPKFIDSIIDALKKNFSISKQCEITMECNPATLTEDKLSGYKAAGVNRLSIGAQSFSDKILEGLGRLHKAADIEENFRLARKAGFENINLDLMFAVPGLITREWRRTVKKALNLRPEHLSFYSLEIAEGTVFDRMISDGVLRETPEGMDRRMYEVCLEEVCRAGFNHYEISNAALPERECRHNLKYWNFNEYLGIGASAHSFINRVRFSNINSIEYYIDAMKKQDTAKGCKLGDSRVFGAGCVDHYHINSQTDNVSEYTFTALRTKRGVALRDFERKFDVDFWDVFRSEKERFEEYVRSGHAVSDSSHIALTHKGINISNKIMALFV